MANRTVTSLFVLMALVLFGVIPRTGSAACTAPSCVACEAGQLGAGSPCDDGDPGTTKDTCECWDSDDDGTCYEWVCEGTEPDPCEGKRDGDRCDDGDPCTRSDRCSCDPEDDCVCAGAPNPGAACDDDDPCTVGDSCRNCDPDYGCECTGTNAPGASCDDGDSCTADDLCSACDPEFGCECRGIERTCDDGNACTADQCDPSLGCLSPVLPCDDGDACTDEICHPVTGCASLPIDCSDGDPFTDDTCNPSAGCAHQPRIGPLMAIISGVLLDEDGATPPPPVSTCSTTTASVAKLSIALLGPPEGDERIRLQIRTSSPAGLVPVAAGVRLRVTTGSTKLVDVTVPGGLRSDSASGWAVNAARTRWTFTTATPAATGGISTVSVRTTTTGFTLIKAKGRGAFGSIAAGLPATLTIGLADVSTGPCIEAPLETTIRGGACTIVPGVKLTCR